MDGISNTFCLVPSALGKGEEKRDNLVTLLDGYFQRNGHHININVLDRAVLLDAHEHPEKYPGLTIRVSGYAVFFTQLTKEQREEVLKRTMHTSIHSHIPRISEMKTNKSSSDCFVANGSTDVDIEDLVVTAKKDDVTVLGAVNNIETFSTTDGPGVRMLVFTQGCPKRCIICSNPETQCISDPNLSPDIAMTDKEVADLLEEYGEFLKPNNGGVTLSGGEPMLQPEFSRAVFVRAHSLGLTTCLDTSGHGNPKTWDIVLPSTDYVMLCPKAMNPEVAAFINGVSKEAAIRAQDMARFIRDNYKDIKLSIRWVLLKDLTDTSAEIDALIKFAKDLSPVLTHVELLPYHTLGREKYDSLGMPYMFDDVEPYKYSEAIRIKEYLENAGVAAALAEE
jgi:pyruvate formate lyase activating enzyme